jgi:hypothetical protein
MHTPQRLHEIEQAVGFTYPPSFVSGFEEFSALRASEDFRRAFSDTRLLLSAPEIAEALESIPTALLPFMREEQSPWPDIYAFDLDSVGPEFRVVVWADHAIVMEWQSFPVFIQWVREHIAKHDTTA